MDKIWKVIGIAMSVVVIGILGFCAVWTARNWNTVYSSFDGSSFYTYEDMQKLKQDTIEECAKNEVKYQNLINELKESVINFQEENKILKQDKQKYQDFYDSFWSDDICKVSIMLNENDLYKVVYVNSGATLSDLVATFGEPESEDGSFFGWVLDLNSDTFLDPTTYEVTSDLILYAIFMPHIGIC